MRPRMIRQRPSCDISNFRFNEAAAVRPRMMFRKNAAKWRKAANAAFVQMTDDISGRGIPQRFALRLCLSLRNLAAQPGRCSWAERSSASASGSTSRVMTLPEPM